MMYILHTVVLCHTFMINMNSTDDKNKPSMLCGLSILPLSLAGGAWVAVRGDRWAAYPGVQVALHQCPPPYNLQELGGTPRPLPCPSPPGNTPLYIAAVEGHPTIQQLLLRYSKVQSEATRNMSPPLQPHQMSPGLQANQSYKDPATF
jgi:hypothetical protein